MFFFLLCNLKLRVLEKRGDCLNAFVFLPPIGGEAAGAGGGEDGLAKAFEQDGNLRQPLLAGVHFAQQRLQLRHNPPLLGERSERDFKIPENFWVNVRDARAASVVVKSLELAGNEVTQIARLHLLRRQCHDGRANCPRDSTANPAASRTVPHDEQIVFGGQL